LSGCASTFGFLGELGEAISLLTVKEIFDLVREDLACVEQELARQSDGASEPIGEMARYLLGNGGKRLRPALLLLTAGYAGYSGPSAIRLGAAVELIHSATLIHDDVIDGADTRRGNPSANSRWGNHRSVLAGDWLYMQSFQMALGERNFKVLDILIDLTQNMVEGELVQLSTLGRMDLREEEVIELAARKTACLFSGCARLGAVLGRVSEEEEQRLADYGRYSGVAFQLVDDLLDFTASPTQLGKPVLSDLKEGKVTLPLVYALESAKHDGAAGRRLVRTVLEEKAFQSVRPEEISALVRESGALDRTRQLAHDYANRAKACLNDGQSEFGRALLAVPDFILDRER
jgi:octaprenyl-diphosphate synthase